MEPAQSIGHRTEHDAWVFTEARGTTERFSKRLPTSNKSLVDVGGASSACVVQYGGTRVFNKLDASKHANGAVANSGTFLTDLVLDNVRYRGLLAQIERNVRVDKSNINVAIKCRCRSSS